MSTEKIYDEQYVRGRIYSFVKFQKYLKMMAQIFCEEMHLDINDVRSINLSEDGNIVYLYFDEGYEGFSSELLWDQDFRQTIKRYYEQT